MGYYRLLLAICVLASHAYPPVFGWNIGAVAVMSFLVISGFTNSILIDRYYPDPRSTGWFYVDKIARLFPLYWFYLAATLVLIPIFDLKIVETQSPWLLLLNVGLLPVGYSDFGWAADRYIPQAWTLGLELTFYAILPLLLLMPRLAKVATLMSIIVAIMAFLGLIDSFVYGYRLLPGLLFVFMAGAGLAASRAWPGAAPLALAVGLCGVVASVLSPNLGAGFSREVAAGICIGVVGVYMTRRLPMTWLDRLTGNLTYGVYLNHNLLISIFDKKSINHLWVLPASLLLAFATYYVIERPVIAWRRGLRTS